MIARIILCFSWWGILSVLVWLAALAACVQALRTPRRYRRYTRALILAGLGACVVQIQYDWMSRTRLDDTAEKQLAAENAEKLRKGLMKGKEEEEEERRKEEQQRMTRYVEDSEGESTNGLVLTVEELERRAAAKAASNGVTTAKEPAGATRGSWKIWKSKSAAAETSAGPAKGEPETGAGSANGEAETAAGVAPPAGNTTGEEAAVGTGAEPPPRADALAGTNADLENVTVDLSDTNKAYLAGGKKSRTAGKIDKHEASKAKEAVVVKAERLPTAILKYQDYELAKVMGRALLFFTDILLRLLLALVVLDYLWRFYHPTDSYLPLPLGGTWFTHFSHTTPLVYWQNPTEEQLRVLREDLARRRQTFLYVGDRLLNEPALLYRVRLALRCRIAQNVKIGPWQLKELPLPTWHKHPEIPAEARCGNAVRWINRHLSWRCWPLTVLVWGHKGVPRDAEFVLDAVWFHRYAVCVPSAAADQLLTELLKMLAGRAATHASVAFQPNLIWDMPRPTDPAQMQALARLCEKTGLRLVLIGQAPPPKIAEQFLTMPND
jgi:hypothetical protein